MASRIGSANFEESLNFPAEFFVRFFKNHGLLQVKNRPQWRVLKGGAKVIYRHLRTLADSIPPQARWSRSNAKNAPSNPHNFQGEELIFDDIAIAYHADQALKFPSDADPKSAYCPSPLLRKWSCFTPIQICSLKDNWRGQAGIID